MKYLTPASIFSTVSVIVGCILIFKIWTDFNPDHIHGLSSEDNKFQVVFDSNTTGNLTIVNNDGSKLVEPVHIQFNAPNEYKISSKSYGDFYFVKEVVGPRKFICTGCKINNQALMLWNVIS